MRTIAIGNNEVEEFLALVGRDSKWGKRLGGAYSFYDPLGDNHPTMQPGYSAPVLPFTPVFVNGELIQTDAFGHRYHLVNNGSLPSGMKYL